MSDKINDGGPAFPCKAHPQSPQDVAFNVPPPRDHLGLSLRDYLAVHAPDVPAAFPRKTWKERRVRDSGQEYEEHMVELLPDWCARWRYAYADAMLLERAK